ncbi:putative phospholipid-transporting ATPase DNF3 [Zancudomyces culisetae]|uniref:Putative phospholipid-transporting ATPase DNF3 n=1 Tax=Zancudomyces culisetae TaxID=1213189 RepID=A0A1R1PLU1_ZANCU|nr:putative phospholipid-transporting ATPase DNF3 [Zancudomyces culisetae]|eukprot:OMH81926.1 putative phospholipid-transporting ATPase DNF3 [Zancudomyces culisetae]
MHSDLDMYDEKTDTPMEARTSTINENLGMVKYILSDKTGTLTENIMRFRAVMVAGLAFYHEDTATSSQKRQKKLDQVERYVLSGSSVNMNRFFFGPKDRYIYSALDLNHNNRASSGAKPKKLYKKHKKNEIDDDSVVGDSENCSVENDKVSGEFSTVSSELTRLPPTNLLRLISQGDVENIDLLIKTANIKSTKKLSVQSSLFIRSMALCHTVQPDIDSESRSVVGYQSTSPDEKALVYSAAELGYILHERIGPEVKIRIVPVERVSKWKETVIKQNEEQANLPVEETDVGSL